MLKANNLKTIDKSARSEELSEPLTSDLSLMKKTCISSSIDNPKRKYDSPLLSPAFGLLNSKRCITSSNYNVPENKFKVA